MKAVNQKNAQEFIPLHPAILRLAYIKELQYIPYGRIFFRHCPIYTIWRLIQSPFSGTMKKLPTD
jgi:hypothetical protein